MPSKLWENSMVSSTFVPSTVIWSVPLIGRFGRSASTVGRCRRSRWCVGFVSNYTLDNISEVLLAADDYNLYYR